MLFGAKTPIGLDIGTGLLKVAQIKDKRGAYELELFDTLPLPPELIVDGSIIDSIRLVDSIKELLRKAKIKAKDAAISVSGHSTVIVKIITLPEMTEEELEESIRFEAEQYIPFDINDVNIDFQIIGPRQEPGQMDVILVAVKKEVINEYMAVVKEAGLNPVVVDVDIFAMENAYEVNYEIEPDRSVALIDVGMGSIKMNILRAGVPAFTRETPMGIGVLTESVQREFSLSYEVAERVIKGEAVEGVTEEDALSVLLTASEDLFNEINRSLDYYRTSMAGEDVTEVMLCGGAAMIKGFADNLAERIKTEVRPIDPFRNISIKKGLDEEYIRDLGPMAAVAVGLALRRVGDK